MSMTKERLDELQSAVRTTDSVKPKDNASMPTTRRTIRNPHPMTDQTKGTTMSESEMRIAIAESVGWKILKLGPDLKDETVLMKWRRWIHPTKDYHVGINGLPNYPQDLNAMHEVEKTLSGEELAIYNNNLIQLVITAPKMPYELGGWYWHATALQRCEAYLRVKGLWPQTKG